MTRVNSKSNGTTSSNSHRTAHQKVRAEPSRPHSEKVQLSAGGRFLGGRQMELGAVERVGPQSGGGRNGGSGRVRLGNVNRARNGVRSAELQNTLPPAATTMDTDGTAGQNVDQPLRTPVSTQTEAQRISVKQKRAWELIADSSSLNPWPGTSKEYSALATGLTSRDDRYVTLLLTHAKDLDSIHSGDQIYFSRSEDQADLPEGATVVTLPAESNIQRSMFYQVSSGAGELLDAIRKNKLRREDVLFRLSELLSAMRLDQLDIKLDALEYLHSKGFL